MDYKVIYIMAIVFMVVLVVAGIYFVIYQRHINKALKDPEGAKNSRIKLPSLGISYTGMWFVAWIVSVLITLIMIVNVFSAANLAETYAEINSEKLNWLQEDFAKTNEKNEKIYDEMMNERYVSEKNAKFELGNFNAEKNTIDLRVTVTDVNMAEGDTVKWRMNGRTVDLKQDLEKKIYTGVINMDIMEFDVDYTLDSVFISEVEGIKRIDRIYKYNRYYQDSDFGLDNYETFPKDYHYLPEGDFGEYWEDYFVDCGASIYEDDGNLIQGCDVKFDGDKLSISGKVYGHFREAVKEKDRRAVSANIVLEVDGKKVSEQKVNVSGKESEEYVETM
ncbi:MAG: hypothetical protein IIT39_15985, partial [Clostridia bacterium]|nr:hypothetical protein [Clostridia bacterium]